MSTSHSICQGDVYTFNGKTLSTSGTYTEKFSTAKGCDSVVTLTLTVSSKIQVSINDTICSGDTYDFDGQIISTAGTYAKGYTSAFGCDSLVTLNLAVETSPTVTVSGNTSFCYGATTEITAAGGSTYAWSNGTSTPSLNTGVQGTYYVMGMTSAGCASTASVTLTAEYPTYSHFFVTNENEYVWNDITYTQSGSYTQTFTGANGCDSIVTLYLTVVSNGNLDFITEQSSEVLTVYPNPGNGVYHISFDKKEYDVFVYDIYGKQVFFRKMSGDDNEMDLCDCCKGVYLMKVVADGIFAGSCKLIKL